jgi:hypothetical protein
MDFDPTKVRLSEHFLLADFLGNHTVYTKGRPNLLSPDDPALPLKMANAKALCKHFLEPFLDQAGPLSISYGYITPLLSSEIVTYQDPRKPSHHRWDLGAACDIVSHEWVNYDPNDNTEESSPIRLAHEIVESGYPFSRLITYSESPFMCVAVAAAEIQSGQPRKAFYENRFVGKKEPQYKSLASDGAKAGALALLKREGLTHGWRGQGYPSHHGGGRRQYHHIRVSKYTMLSDWLFDLQSIANGAKNIPNVQDQGLMDSFYRAGDLYDDIILGTGINRFSIIGGFVHGMNPYFKPDNDWRNGQGSFTLVPPASVTSQSVIDMMRERVFNSNVEGGVWAGSFMAVDPMTDNIKVYFQLQDQE